MSEQHLILIDRVTRPIQCRQSDLKHATPTIRECLRDLRDVLDTRDTTNLCQRTRSTLDIEGGTPVDMPRSESSHQLDDRRSNIDHADDSKHKVSIA